MNILKRLFIVLVIMFIFTSTGCNKEHEHEFVNGECACGEKDSNYVPPHVHEFVNGYCSCGDSNKTEFRVIFIDHEGTILKEQIVQKNSAAIAPKAPERYGYEFIGWSHAFTQVTTDLIISAQYSVKDYVTVIFDADNGDNLNTINVNFNTPVNEPAVPSKKGYNFLGWYKDDVQWDFSTPIDKDIKLTAKWEIGTYNLTFELNGGKWKYLTSCQHSNKYFYSDTFQYGEEIAYLFNENIPVKLGYDFKGWSKIFDTMPNEDIVVTPIWEYNEFFDYVEWDENGIERTPFKGTMSEVTIPSYIIFKGDFDHECMIPSFLFENNQYVEVINISEGITKIWHSAFKGCTNLKTVNIPESVTFISPTAQLPSSCYTIFEDSQYIGTADNPYKFLVELNRDRIHSNTEFLAFYGITDIYLFSTIRIPTSLKDVPIVLSSNEEYHSYGNMTVLDNIIYLGTYDNPYKFVVGCTDKSNLIELNLHPDAEIISSHAFADCYYLEKVILHSNITRINSEAFANCTSLYQMFIPNSVEYVGYRAFTDTNIEVEATYSDTLNLKWDNHWFYFGNKEYYVEYNCKN